MKARIKRVLVNPQAFLSIMATGTSWTVSQGVPEGAKLRGFTTDPLTQSLHLFIEHESFPLIDVYAQVAPVLATEFLKVP